MGIKLKFFVGAVFFLLQVEAKAQEKWNLKTCVEYAMENNLGAKQTQFQAGQVILNTRQNKLSRWPTLNGAINSAFNSGNNQDPTTFSRVTENYISAGFQLQSSADIFNFFSKKYNIQASQWDELSAKANVNKVKYDVALATANAYLQVLLARQQVKISAVQIEQTFSQLDRTIKMVAAGTLPALNQTQIEAQWAMDSSNYYSAVGNAQQAMLGLRSTMSLDPLQPFDIEEPEVESIPVEPIADLLPELVYAEAIQLQPQQIGNRFRVKSATTAKKSAYFSRYPTLSAFGSLGSNYLSFNKRPIYNKSIIGYQSTGLVADAGNGVLYDVQSPIFTNTNIAGYIEPGKLFNQFENNFRKSVGLNLSVPLFNGGTSKIAYQKAAINLMSAELQLKQDDQKLKQDIYLAYTQAMTALQRFEASKKTVMSTEKTYDFAQKRYQIGMLNIFDLTTSQNNLYQAKLEYNLNRFDYVFKMKVLEFYKGKGIKL
jgi:outer membrane protein